MNYWLLKSEPAEYSIDDLASEPESTGRWDGIRNYQARNILRDKKSIVDAIFIFYVVFVGVVALNGKDVCVDCACDCLLMTACQLEALILSVEPASRNPLISQL